MRGAAAAAALFNQNAKPWSERSYGENRLVWCLVCPRPLCASLYLGARKGGSLAPTHRACRWATLALKRVESSGYELCARAVPTREIDTLRFHFRSRAKKKSVVRDWR